MQPDIDSNPASALIELALLIGQGRPEVRAEMEAWIGDPATFRSQYATDTVRDHVSVSEDQFEAEVDEYLESLDNTLALLQCLERSGDLGHVDWKQAPDEVLDALDLISGGGLQKSPAFEALLGEFRESKFGIGAFLDHPLPVPALLQVVEDAGFALEALDAGSDSYPLILIPLASVGRAHALAEAADVRLYFKSRRAAEAHAMSGPADTDTGDAHGDTERGNGSSRRWFRRKNR